MIKQPSFAPFFLLAGIGFVILAVIIFVSSAHHTSDDIIPTVGVLFAGLMLIYAGVGLRRNKGGTPPK